MVQVSCTRNSLENLSTRNLHIQVAHRTIQVSCTRNLANDRDADLAVAANLQLSCYLHQMTKFNKNKIVKNGYSRGLHSISSTYHALLHKLHITDAKDLKNFFA